MRRIIPMRLPLLALLASAVVMAGEAEPANLAKSTWTTVAKAGDIWSCLQLEAWGRTRTPVIKLGPALGASVVIGDPLFALPDRVSDLADFGDRIVAWTRERAFVLAPDGRPLQASVLLQPDGGNKEAGFGGKVIGTVRRHERNNGTFFLEFATTRVGDGQRLVTATHHLGERQVWEEGAVVADDGSAVATQMGIDDPARPAQAERPRIILVATDKAPAAISVPGLRRPQGIGRSGVWLIARNLRDHLILHVADGQRRQRIQHAAIGPGIAACFIEGKPFLIGLDGKSTPLQGGPAIGTGDFGLRTVGGWLVLSSGHGAKTVSEGDLLGENAGKVTDQPRTLGLWRWADLAADPQAKPAASVVGYPARADDQSAALWLWEGTAIDLFDLSGHEPVRSRYLQVPEPVGWVYTSMHATVVEQPKDRRLLYSPERKLIWEGACSGVQVKRRDLALIEQRVGDSRSWSLQWLAEDPAKRRVVKLSLRPGEYVSAVSWRAPDLVMVSNDEEQSWRVLDFDGKQLMRSSVPPAPPIDRPTVPEWSWYTPVGRWYRDGARIVPKASGPSPEFMQRLCLRDAWRVGGSTLLLDDEGHLWISGRKKGEWLDAGSEARANRFAMGGKQLILAQWDRPLSVIVPGPKLEPAERIAQVDDLPPGPWRLERSFRFMQPRGKQYDWDFARVGWGDIKLRSPEQSGMFIVTRALVVELVPEMAKHFGQP